MITPRVTRLVRVASPGLFRDALAALACEGDPLAARDRLIIVPTRAAAAHLARAIETRALAAGVGAEPGDARRAVVLPDLVTPRELPVRLAERLTPPPAVAPAAVREVLMGTCCREAAGQGYEPPFRLRPALIAEVLGFYDELRRRGRTVTTFESIALDRLEPGADYDRGAERLVRQTRFLAQAFRLFEAAGVTRGMADEHTMRARAATEPAPRPWRHVVVSVGDRSRDPHGLFAADWSLLTRMPGLERLDVVATDQALAGPWHERVHEILPGIEEVRVGDAVAPLPVLVKPPAVLHANASRPEGHAAPPPTLTWVARDREDELIAFAHRVRAMRRRGELARTDEVALVVRQPLPYVYLAREVLRSAGLPCQFFDALPLAAEPFSAALDLVVSFVSSSFARVAGIALLRSPHLAFSDEGEPLRAADVALLDRLLTEWNYLGDLDALRRLAERAEAQPADDDEEAVGAGGATGEKGRAARRRARVDRARPALRVLLDLATSLAPFREPLPIARQLDTLIAFLHRHEVLPGPDDPSRERQLRARSAIHVMLASLRDAYDALDPEPAEFDLVAALIRRWIEGQTFAPRTGDEGVHLVDAASAPYGDFAHVQLAGLVDGEWPDRPRRNIFYATSVLRDLGWDAESERLDAARAAFADLLRLPSTTVALSTFSLEQDAIVTPSPLLDELTAEAWPSRVESVETVRVTEAEMLALAPPVPDALADGPREAALARLARPPADEARFRGQTGGHQPTAWSLSALERYQDCPFKFFAADVLRLEELPEDQPSLSPRARGRFLHEVFQRFFEAWDARGLGTITAATIHEARVLFEQVAEPLLTALGEPDTALERARLFGSAIAVGIVDVVLRVEAERPVGVRSRWLERSFDGEFSLGVPGGRRVRLRGIADRIDLLQGNRLRVIDYKSGSAPNTKRALQVPIYALCAAEQLEAQDQGQDQGDGDGGREGTWAVDEAAYVAFSGKRTLASVVKPGEDPAPALEEARARLFEAVDGVERGEFPPRPHDIVICGWCAYARVCRKDYIDE